MQNEETYLFESRKEPKNSPAKFRMLFHQVIFTAGQATGLIQNRIGNADFADVVKQGSDLDIAKGCFAEVEFLSDAHSPLRKASAVNSSPQIFKIEELVERTDDRVALRGRSEEHTSELQSPVHLVCRRLLEK